MKRGAEPGDLNSSSDNKHPRREANEVIDAKLRSFDVFPLSRFNRQFPFFRQPFELGSFSLDANRLFLNDKSQLRTYIPPTDYVNINWNLRFGYDTFIRRDDSVNEYLDHLLEWILANRKLVVDIPHGSSKGSVDRYF